jgi:hypothetical protein
MVDPAVGALLGGVGALLFATAALQKLRDLGRFSEVLRAYRVLPEGLLRFAWLVPTLEAAVAVGLLAAASSAAAGAAGSGLLVIYAGAIAVNLRRGRRDLACGCGGPDERRPIAAWMVSRNLLLAALLGVLLLPSTTRPLGPVDALTIGAGIAVASLIYMSADRLLGRVRPATALLRSSR